MPYSTKTNSRMARMSTYILMMVSGVIGDSMILVMVFRQPAAASSAYPS